MIPKAACRIKLKQDLKDLIKYFKVSDMSVNSKQFVLEYVVYLSTQCSCIIFMFCIYLLHYLRVA